MQAMQALYKSAGGAGIVLPFHERSSIILPMNKLSLAKRTQIVSCLVEGNSIRATCRMTGAAKGTVLRLLRDLGMKCELFQEITLRELTCKRVQADEIWSFCYAKQRNVPDAKKGRFGYGDVWTWVGMCADTKLAIGWRVGSRDADTALVFMDMIAGRLRYPVQLTTDGHAAYLDAVDTAFGGEIDYAQLIKHYGQTPEGARRYSPAECTGCTKQEVSGTPDPRHISTSYIERQNLTMRMHMRRFTRLTNAFSKKVSNLMDAVSLHFMFYNFARGHQSLGGKTPAMAAGVADHKWSIAEIVALLDWSAFDAESD